MNTKVLLVAGVLVGVVTLTYFAQATTPGDSLYTYKTDVAEPLESAVTLGVGNEAELQATRFAERVEEIRKLANREDVTEKQINTTREELAEQFERTFTLIQEVEKDGNLAEAATARAIMQTAIEYNMSMDESLSTEIQMDLEAYSKILTESLIQMAINN